MIIDPTTKGGLKFYFEYLLVIIVLEIKVCESFAMLDFLEKMYLDAVLNRS